MRLLWDTFSSPSLKKLENNMNVTEAVEMLKQKKTLITNNRIGWFTMGDKYINFSCPGDYPCCHDDYTIDEFFDIFKDDTFELN
ncbi:hypothetical protein EB155_10385 [archaeon]|nr:hypothetical protein [archaeon]NDB56284.1 hypothetical protein [archaeon]NDB80259.1 hypothetical protein [archaeon]